MYSKKTGYLYVTLVKTNREPLLCHYVNNNIINRYLNLFFYKHKNKYLSNPQKPAKSALKTFLQAKVTLIQPTAKSRQLR